LGKRWTQFAWALNGWGNHAYATSVLVALFPIFLDKYWAVGVPGTTSTGWLGLANGGASAVVMVLAPVLGALADRRAWKKRLLALFTVLGAFATAALAMVERGGYALALPLFAIASIGFFTSSSLFDALLLRVAEPAESDRVSSFGYALGYLGGGLIFLIDVLMVLYPARFGLADAVAATQAAFVSVAVWWLLFMLPLLIWVPEGPPTRQPSGWRELRQTAREIFRQRPLRLFLLAYWIYMDALGTLQQMAADFGAKMGFPSDALIKALLMVQFVSFPAALAFGWLAGRIGTRRAIYVGLTGLVLVSLWSYFLHTVQQFYWMAGVVGLVQGGVQALSRSYFSRLIPAGKGGEYFGFYNFLGKFAAVIGPFVVGAVAVFTGNQRLSIAPLALAFILGAWLLSRVREAPGGTLPEGKVE
jgi:Permeases of the major facilitator superfamily